MAEKFPGVGHRYRVDFGSWKTQLEFSSESSLTYTAVRKDGTLGDSEMVSIAITPVRDLLFLVTWQESDKTTVVHLEDYKDWKIITHITDKDAKFSIFHGTMSQIA